MKLNLGCRDDVRQNYINIDIHEDKDNNPLYRQGNFDSLDWIVEDKSVEEIVALNVLSEIPLAKLGSTISNWSKKLEIGGVLKISIPDIYLLAKSFVHNQMGSAEFLQLVYGKDKINKSGLDSDALLDILKECELSILSKRYDGMAFYVEATKDV